ncbi:MAG TPA: hypothetical protein VKA59_27965 [Vicinamibacterales bacterium]|nr:hypothetical protein [Vicinamibacterales bacterium]
MKKLSGWQKVGLFAGIGCFSFVALLVVGFAIAVFYAKSTLADLGDTTPTQVERTIAIQTPPAEAPAPGTKPAAQTANGPMQLNVELQEGTFEIKPGEPNGRVQVDGRFSEALYELTQRTDTENGRPRTTIRFRSKAPMWARMLAGIGNDDNNRPKLTVLIPLAVPIELSLNVSMGESRIDLGGLTLSDLGLDLSMGNHEVDFRQPVVDGITRLRLNTRMGNVRVENLGNARAKSVEASGRMGNLTADLGGEWKPGSEAELSFTQSMGQVNVNVPTKVRLQADVRDAEGKAQNVGPDADETKDPKAPVIKVRVSTSMGEGRVSRY